MNYIIYRILGNDLPPRHSRTQTWSNLNFILDNESSLSSTVEKRFILNRIVDEDKQEMYIDLLERNQYKYTVIPFNLNEYLSLGLDNPKDKIAYITNVNPARNLCINQGLGDPEIDYVLPLDGASFFTGQGWEEFDMNVRANKRPFFVLGQCRINTYDELLSPNFQPDLTEEYVFGKDKITGVREYTVAFGRKADIRFNEDMSYPHGDKIELLWRLGLSGIWDRWYPDIKKECLTRQSIYSGTVIKCGYVVRLPSGSIEADNNNIIRGELRAQSLIKLMRALDRLV